MASFPAKQRFNLFGFRTSDNTSNPSDPHFVSHLLTPGVLFAGISKVIVPMAPNLPRITPQSRSLRRCFKECNRWLHNQKVLTSPLYGMWFWIKLHSDGVDGVVFLPISPHLAHKPSDVIFCFARGNYTSNVSHMGNPHLRYSPMGAGYSVPRVSECIILGFARGGGFCFARGRGYLCVSRGGTIHSDVSRGVYAFGCFLDGGIRLYRDFTKSPRVYLG